MTVREIIEKVDEIDLIIEQLKCESKDVDPILVCDILEEYQRMLLDKTVE